MIPRTLEQAISRYAREYPVLAVVGPRQSGKTTLVRKLFPGHAYLSLENLDLRQQAEDDPRGFFHDHPAPVVLDEAQRVPQLFSYLQERVDTDSEPGQYILTGSHQFLLLEKIAQSLAGRIATFRLFPFTFSELSGQAPDTSLEEILDPPRRDRPALADDLSALICKGFYPPIHARRLTARTWLENYLQTYVERDIRLLVNVGNLRTFENFLKLCAAHSGQLLNYAAIANAAGVSLPTVKRWVSLLETSGIILLLPPHHRNFSKRVVKTPKLYFVDTGLLCLLLSIRQPGELAGHPLRGHIFETLVVSEYYKRIAHLGETPPLYFWRDKTGNEIDLIVDLGARLFPIEIKSSQTFSPVFKEGLNRWFALKGNTNKRGRIVYAGDQLIGRRAEIQALPWWAG
jgi:predicted AAA+ superfamily ATPase